MKKELKELFESEVLSEETKVELQEAIEAIKAEAITEAKETAKKELEVEYATKFVNESKIISEKLDKMIQEGVVTEIEDLKADLAKYKDLEVTYATKLTEFKESYSEKLGKDLTALVESLVGAECVELKEDLMESKKNYFGTVIYEAYADMHTQMQEGSDEDALKQDLTAVQKLLAESNKKIADFERGQVMEGLLSNIAGDKREVMKNILEGVETDKLEDRYNETIDTVLKESVENTDKKEQLDESANITDADKEKQKEELRAMIN